VWETGVETIAIMSPFVNFYHKGNKQGLRCAGVQLGVADNERE
jgi:hypothetical protein